MTDDAIDKYAPELGDWRLMHAGWVTATNGVKLDVPKAFRGSTWYAPVKGNQFSFATPSASALHLNAAWKAAERARRIKDGLAIHVYITRPGDYNLQTSEQHTAALFDYFEEMIAVAFGSFGAIEAYCNQLIIELATQPMTLVRKRGTVLRSAEQVEREAPTDEKLKRIVPDLLGIPTPCGKAIWESYLRIKRVRDAVTHFKRNDQMRHADKAHEPTVLLDLYKSDCFELPEDAMKVLDYIQPVRPRWMLNPAWKRSAAVAEPPIP